MTASAAICPGESSFKERLSASTVGIFASMSADFTAHGNASQPRRVTCGDDTDRMDGYDDLAELKRVLAANVITLMKHHWGGVNKSRLRTAAGETDPATGQLLRKAGMGTFDRLMEETRDVGIDVLRRIGRAFGLEVWQLLIPDLDPTKPPECRGMSPLAADLARCFDRIEDETLRRTLHATIDQLARKVEAPEAPSAAPKQEPHQDR
jgi:hypothetical protein